MNERDADRSDAVIASIRNNQNPDQSVDILYWREENAFVTSGIQRYFAEKEILIPTHLVALDLNLIGTIISAILEELSRASEKDGAFLYTPQFDVMDKTYTLTEKEEYMLLERMTG
jgi:hypothetical protein